VSSLAGRFAPEGAGSGRGRDRLRPGGLSGPAPQVCSTASACWLRALGMSGMPWSAAPRVAARRARAFRARRRENRARDPFKVGKRDYETSMWTLATVVRSTPNPKTSADRAGEQESLVRAFSTFSNAALDTLTLDLPSEGRVSGGFGLRALLQRRAAPAPQRLGYRTLRKNADRPRPQAGTCDRDRRLFLQRVHRGPRPRPGNWSTM